MLKRSALAGLLFAGFASGAFAQAVPQARPAAQLPMLYDNSSQRMLQRQSMTNGDPESNVTPEQYRRARKAATMIKANQCEEAYKMALDEQDNRLALNIAVACKARFKE